MCMIFYVFNKGYGQQIFKVSTRCQRFPLKPSSENKPVRGLVSVSLSSGSSIPKMSLLL